MWATQIRNTLQTGTFHLSVAGTRISRPIVLVEIGRGDWAMMEEPRVRIKARRSRGEWRGRAEIRLVREAASARAASGDKSWSLLITTDSFIISTYWTYGEFTTSSTWVDGGVYAYVRTCMSTQYIEYITFSVYKLTVQDWLASNNFI